ncbi:MAG TPA: 30S ribosomal protein S4 [Candidatus Acidoferrum sp.]|nr:30S ribosomal protein S4 [Candidatus Acidoferrum sp.]
MGAPKRNRRKYLRPKEIWSTERITSDGSAVEEYGLKNMKELWIAQTRVGRVRRNAREYLSGASGANKEEVAMIARLAKFGISKADATLDDLLDLNEKAFLERRLQSIVARKGLARTMKQARQLIVHGYISINGKKVNKPGYLVSLDEEKAIGYYKPIQIQKVAQNPDVGTVDVPAEGPVPVPTSV